jgi:metacaspase-1
MSHGNSLHIGLNRVDPLHYKSDFPLSGCHNDARDMAAIAREQGFSAKILLDADATVQRVLSEIGQAAQALQSGDAFLLTYAGHGSQVPDRGGDEKDGLDETWLLFDRMLLDDEIYMELSKFAPGVRILVISDSCHSGTITRETQYRGLAQSQALAPFYGGVDPVFRTPGPGVGARVLHVHATEYAAAWRSIDPRARERVMAPVIQISGCKDEQLAADGPSNGLFTGTLKRAWRAGAFTGTHRGFWQTISRDMPPTQSPVYLVFGTGIRAFERQCPFTVSFAAPDPDRNKAGGKGMSTGNHDSDGNWAEVQAALERRFQGRGPSGLLQNPAAANAQTAVDAFTKATGLTLPQALVGDRGWGEVRAPTGSPSVHAFWWGFHIEVSSQGLQEFMSVADPIIAVIRKIGPMTGPAAPWIALVAGFIAGALKLIEVLDKGRGVYINMAWFAPGIFVPTSV